MNVTISKTDSMARTVVIDLSLLCVMCLVPTLSHVFTLPLYILNPMLMCLLAGVLLVDSRANAYILAVLMPVVSMLITGMPIPPKAMCMVVELASVVAVLHLLENKVPHFIAVMSAVLAGKVVFYLFKALVLTPAVLFETNIVVQIIVAVAIAGVYAFVRKRQTK